MMIYNYACLKCDAIDDEMTKVGPMVFCNNCFKVEFVDTDEWTQEKGWEIDPKGETYKDWLVSYKKYIEERMED